MKRYSAKERERKRESAMRQIKYHNKKGTKSKQYLYIMQFNVYDSCNNDIETAVERSEI